MRRVRCYDNGGATADRYTVVWLRPYKHNCVTYYCVASMSTNPFHPQGVWGSTDTLTRRYSDSECREAFGTRIPFRALPEPCRKAIKQYWPED